MSDSGKVYSRAFGPEFWLRYLDVFESVSVVCRLEKCDEKLAGAQCIDDPRIRFFALPYYRGRLRFFLVFPFILFALARASLMRGGFVIRLPGMVGSLLSIFLVVFRRKFAVELVGDPDGVFSVGGVGGIFSPPLRWFFVGSTKLACRMACAASYVTSEMLQHKYPASPFAFASHFSSVYIPGEAIVHHKRIRKYSEADVFRILMVGSMEQVYKGFDILIDVLPSLVSRFPNIKVTIAGDGKCRPSLIRHSDSLGVGDNVEFIGDVSRDKVFDLMDSSDLFVMPSRTEGLPRALIEAFSRGLPAIGSDVGGISELLDPEFCFPSDDRSALGDILFEVIDDVCVRSRMSRANIAKAREYADEVLSERRLNFYSRIRDFF